MKSVLISALRASAVLGTAFSAKTAEEQEFCNLLDPQIRKDCGIAAAGNDSIVTKAECEGLNCCWDTTLYRDEDGKIIESPWCFYPVYYKAPGDTDIDDNDVFPNNIETNDFPLVETTPKTTSPTTKPTLPTTTEKMVTITEKIVIERVPIVERPVIKPITFSKPSPSLVNRPISSVSKKNPNSDHGDLVTSYRKKTCQQLSESKVLNETMKDLTMERMKCNTVDFLNFDHQKDPNLNQDTSNGMEILMKKYNDMKAQKTASTPSKNPLVGNNPGGIFPLVDNNKSKNDDEGISSTEKMILENPVYAKLMPERVKKIKRKTKTCKNQIRELAPAYMKKSAFSNTEKKKLENTCGSVPDGEYMAELLLSMNLIKQSEEEEIKWILPDEELDYELVEWHIMEKCLGRIDMLETDYNCMDKSSDIFDSNSCNAKGCIWMESKCFYCHEAIENQRENKLVIENADEEYGQCKIIDSDKKKACEGYDSDSTFDKLLQMNMGGGTATSGINPTMNILMKKMKKKKCEKLGCCYKAGSKTKDIMMMMLMSQQQNQANQAASMNPMMAMMGRKKRSLSSLSGLSGLSGLNGLNGLGSGGMVNMNQLLISKMMSKDDETDCFEPLDDSIITADQCQPDKAAGECGQAADGSDGTDQPWHLVISDEANEIHCGATMICSEWAITTASCLKVIEDRVADFDVDTHISIYSEVNSGAALTAASKGQILDIKYHPLFNGKSKGKVADKLRLHHDMAVIRVNFEADVMPICLPSLVDNTPEVIFSYGFGRFGFNDGEDAGPIKKTEFEITEEKICTTSYGKLDFTKSICANLVDTDAQSPICEGDRGGAGASVDEENAWTIQGLIAGGPISCDFSEKPAVFLSIRTELQWILEATNNCCTVLSFF